MARIELGGSGDPSTLLASDNTWAGDNDFTGALTVDGVAVSTGSSGGALTDGSVTEAKMATALLHTIEGLIIWDGSTGSQPLRTTATADTARPVRWRQPTAPPTTTGYAIAGLDVWEKYTP